MKKLKTAAALAAFSPLFFEALAAQRGAFVLPPKPAVALQNVALFPDSSLTSQSSEMIAEGEVVEVLGASATEHLDKDQNQKFPFFRVQKADGKTGWAFGDGLAIGFEEASLPEEWRGFHQKSAVFGIGFEQSTTWLASIDGRDKLHENDFMNPLYSEHWLIVTNARGRSVSVQIGHSSASGRAEPKLLRFLDVTADRAAEIVLETSSRSPSNPVEQRELQIFSIRNGSLQKIFEEKVSLFDASEQPQPSVGESFEIEAGSIRRERVEFLPLADYSLKNDLLPLGLSSETAIEQVTETLVWTAKTSRFEPLYPESRTAPRGEIRQSVRLKNRPESFGSATVLATMGEKCQILKLVEQIAVVDGRKKMRPWLLVKTASGATGYLEAAAVKWEKTRLAPVLAAFSEEPPLVRADWFFDFPFVKIVAPTSPSIGKN